MKIQIKIALALAAISFLALVVRAGAAKAGDDEAAFRSFLKAYEEKVVPLSREANLASFQASVSGRDGDYQRSADLQVQLKRVHADTAAFARLKAFREGGKVGEPLLKRQLDILYNAYLGNQVPDARLEEMVRLQTRIEQSFNTFRMQVDGQALSDNDAEEILRTATDSARLEKVWKASKEVGRLVAPDILKLVALRNEAARGLGFANFQQMQLRLNEQDPAQVEALFDELDGLTRDGFAALKGDVDAFLAARCGIERGALRPWHYQNRFFQEAPAIYAVDLDSYYRGREVVALARDYYKGIGLDVADVIAGSDLFEKPGKYQHAFSSDIDRSGDVRVLCSVKPDAYWMNTLLHEFGHSVYSKCNDPSLPWLLRDAAHSFTTEAVANFFGRFAASPSWLRDAAGVPAAECERIRADSRRALRLQQMVFSRWAQVMFRFEKSLYEDPGQDLNRRWWELAGKYQLLAVPAGRDEPDWAAKIHIALYPCYYHNYLLGELLASQLYDHIAGQVLKCSDQEDLSFAGRPEVGRFLVEKVFRPGMRWPWPDMIERACGGKLTAAHYARQFVGGK